MNTWEIGKQIEKIMESCDKAADAELEQLFAGRNDVSARYEAQKEAWDKLINWKGVIIR